jgi:cyclic beta-1,2-glucan synthetase
MAVFLLCQTYVTVDAIIRTLVRLFLTRRHLLEWETAASAERRLGTGLRHFLRAMWQAPALAVAFALLIWLARPDALLPANLFLIPWLLSPLVAFLVSQPIAAREAALTPDEQAELGRLARRTWRYFETFVGDADHWLPPDNFQEEPKARVAHRTSPTNQGLLLLATLAAHDLGYLSLGALVERLEKTLATFDRLPRYRGHFFNWYDTLTLQPLQPTYISTVDSGNLVGCLIALKQGLLEKMDQPILGPTQVRGLRETLGVMAELLRGARLPNDREAVHRHGEFQAVLQTLAGQLQDSPTDLAGWREWLSVLSQQAGILHEQAHRLAEHLPNVSAELESWTDAFAQQVRNLEKELTELAPWAGSLRHAPVAGAIRDELSAVFSLAEVAARRERVANELTALEKDPPPTEDRQAWVRRVHEALQTSTAPVLLERCRQLAGRADALAAAIDFRFLYKPDRHLFAIGYNVTHDRLDESAYDLLASEARLASFLAIARGEVPHRHWFHLGRLVTRVGTRLCLLSWGGTMFEYLMPQLLLRRYGGTLLAESCDAAVARQIAYGRETGVPWGISESAFSSRYAGYDYQYQSFGVPGLGLKRDLNQDLVVAPYATALAAMVRPREALHNLRRLAEAGVAGRYGFFEAIDFTRRRLPAGRRSVMVRCFMAHHQGMSLVALANCLLGDPMVRRFHAEPLIRATELLLQERVPSAVTPVEPAKMEPVPRPATVDGPSLLSRRLTTPCTPSPRTHLLSNGKYHVMVTNTGAGFSRWGDLDVTRWREDATRDAAGQFCYIRDLRSGLLWSAGYHPVGRLGEEFEVIYSADKAEFRRVDGLVATHLEVTVSPEHPAEVRRLTLTNHDTQAHDLEVTSYAEIVLAAHEADLAHPAFGKLFLETEWVADHEALLCRRRSRASEQTPVWAVHVAAGDGPAVGAIQFETDRARFLGRGRTPASPAALERGAVLSRTTGPVLDPVVSLRRRVRLAPGAAATVTFCMAVAQSREAALALADHFRDPQAILRTLDLAWAHSQVELRHLRLSTAEAILFQRLAAYLLYAQPALRAARDVLTANRQGQPDLWRYGISGDRPIVLARIANADELALVQQLLSAHTYWRLRGLEVDLVILCDRPAGYFEELFQQIQAAVRSSDAHDSADKPGGVFVRRASHIPEDDKILLQSAARVVLLGQRGSLAAQLDRADAAGLAAAPPTERRRRKHVAKVGPGTPVTLPASLVFANGLGGFTPDGREYCILPYQPVAGDALPILRLPPAPWINVIANPLCGFLVSESGFGSTWVGNSQANRLTPWSNDPVLDPPTEVVYLRDEATGDVWTPTPRPLGQAAPTLVRHGQGYTVFQRHSHGLAQELTAFVPADEPVKVILLRVHNTGSRPRRLAVTYYAEWLLGTVRDRAALEVITEVDPETGALLARNPCNQDFAGQVAFADVSLRPRTWTADRTEFLGRNGSPVAPAALSQPELSGRVGPALDPCAVVQAAFTLESGEAREIIFLLGASADRSMARDLVQKYREPARALTALEEVKDRWEQVLGAVQVRTPDAALDLLLNRWLIYQVLSCRLWGRSAFYQSSGAYGFRDQLQDVMALVYGAPEQARAHILRAAGRQFVEGDVQHWWHPPTGRGIRTRMVDDLLWLPFVTCHYVIVTGDYALLDERVPFLRAPVLQPGQEDDYRLPETADESGTVYEHCVRALGHSLRFGVHGLPLMGTGDWNDGMNRVGAGGQGESVWDGWFLLTCLNRFAELAEARDDAVWAVACREYAERLRRAIEEHAWDGCWYRRAYFDDGTPLGSAANDECQIDAIAQAWAVLSGAADPTRARQALAAVDERLVRREDKLIRLLAPPFDQGRLQPGYIKGYVPGIRENGGQYTHAAAWVVQAAALLGDGSRAMAWFDLLNPIRHAASPEAVALYRVEPYVLAGDMYGEAPHTGRGGWTWYTGSAAWLYRVALESILGFQLHGNRLRIQPCIPRTWPGFALTFRYRSAVYHITIDNPHTVEHGVSSVVLDGQAHAEKWIPLVDDGRVHEIRIVLGE